MSHSHGCTTILRRMQLSVICAQQLIIMGNSLLVQNESQLLLAGGLHIGRMQQQSLRNTRAVNATRKQLRLFLVSHSRFMMLKSSLVRHQQQEKATNRRMLLKILLCIRFLACQGLSLRGVGADADSNLLQLLQLQYMDCPELSGWMSKKTGKITSHDIQNEMMKIMALQILQQVCERMRDSGWYTILADECTDMANKEQFTICVTRVDNSCFLFL